VVHIITGLGQGGAENALYRLIAADQVPSRFTVISLTGEGEFGPRLQALGVRVFALECRTGMQSPLAVWRIIHLLRQVRPNVVQTWMYHADLLGGIAAKAAGVPVCWGVRNSVLSSEHIGCFTNFIARLCSWASPFIPTKIVSCSQRAIDAHVRGGYENKFVLIPNGLDLTSMTPSRQVRDGARIALGIPLDAPVVGHVGRAHPMKDHRTLLEAFELVRAEVPQARLLLVGQGLAAESEYLCKHTEGLSLGNSVHALGARQDIGVLMNAMDVFALTSVAEAFPNVLLEAMACGVPCVVTDVGDAAAIVGESGWVCAPQSASEVASALLLAIREEDVRKRKRSGRARQRVEQEFSVDAMVSAYNAVWTTAVVGKTKVCAA
jgi:glycosyltransferase involved in cell wall biosynthesis